MTRGRPDGLFVDGETESARPYGAYVEGLDRFDAEFFRIAPSEAELLDPQQRLLLEVSWAALEDAGLAPGRLRGSRTGVYGGVCGSEYQMLVGVVGGGAGAEPVSGDGGDGLDGGGTCFVRAGAGGSGDHGGHGVFVVAGGGAPGGDGLLQGEADLALAGG